MARTRIRSKMNQLITTFENAMDEIGIRAIYWLIGAIIGFICICVLQLIFNFIKYLFYNKRESKYNETKN